MAKLHAKKRNSYWRRHGLVRSFQGSLEWPVHPLSRIETMSFVVSSTQFMAEASLNKTEITIITCFFFPFKTSRIKKRSEKHPRRETKSHIQNSSLGQK
jgi:hypothetical protein